jgi:hypothetical protein
MEEYVSETVSLLMGLLGAALSRLAYLRYKRDIHHVRKRISIGSHIAQTRCGPIEYAVAGTARRYWSCMVLAAATIRISSSGVR